METKAETAAEREVRLLVAAARKRGEQSEARRIAATRDDVDEVRTWMGSADVEPGLEAGDGYFISHEVRVTEPWRPSLVRLGERPRVADSTSTKKCQQCRTEFRGINRARYCGLPDCNRARTRARVAAHRSK